MAKKKLNENVPIELIDRSAGTQQRPLSPETVDHYVALRKDGAVLPPIEVIFTGKVYVVWDGFHRLAVAKKLGETQVRANIEVGNLRRAIFMSFHANSQHGLPRQPHCLKDIITKMLADAEWEAMGLAEIGRHVGCSRSYVHQCKNPTDEPKTRQALDKCKGNHTSSEPPKTEREPKTPLHDGAGQIIPLSLADRFLARSVIQDRINGIDKEKNAIVNSIGNGDMTYALLNQNGFEADFQRLRSRLKAAVPYALCPYCKDLEGCGGCHNSGFVNEETWKAAPK